MVDIEVSGCFLEGSSITMNGGRLNRIQEIVRGDQVTSFDRFSGMFVPSTVTYVKSVKVWRFV